MPENTENSQSKIEQEAFFINWMRIVFVAFPISLIVSLFIFPQTQTLEKCFIFKHEQTLSLNLTLFTLLFLSISLLSPLILAIIQKPHKTQLFSIRSLLMLLLIASICLYVLGIFSPFLKITKFFICQQYTNVLQTVRVFWVSQEYFLAFVLGAFSLVFPLVKYASLLLMLGRSRKTRLDQILQFLGKFSMTDVFVVGIVILILKQQSSFANAHSQVGLWYFGISVLLGMLVGIVLQRKIPS